MSPTELESSFYALGFTDLVWCVSVVVRLVSGGGEGKGGGEVRRPKPPPLPHPHPLPRKKKLVCEVKYVGGRGLCGQRLLTAVHAASPLGRELILFSKLN